MSDHVFCVRASWREVGGAVTWSAVCERCGAELEIDAGAPVTIIRTIDVPESQMARVAEEIRKAWNRAIETGRPIVTPGEHFDVKQVSPNTLDRALAEHARTCPGATGR